MGKSIGQMKEKAIHRQLKEFYCRDNGIMEVDCLGYIVDVLKDDIIYEIQTGNFHNIKKKIIELCKSKKVVLVHPIAVENFITTLNKNGQVIRRRKSPKKGGVENIFDELVSAPEFINEKNLTLEVVLISKEEIRVDDGKGSWRRRGISKVESELKEILEIVTLNEKNDYLNFLPRAKCEFTNKELAIDMGLGISQARKITYTLRKANILDGSAKKSKEILYRINNN